MDMASGSEMDLNEAVRIAWLGHSMFLLEDGIGTRLVTDPLGEGIGYTLPDIEADIVLVSHDHFDHSNIGLIKGSPVVIRDISKRELGDITIEGFSAFHDSGGGGERGPNIVYRWRMQGLTFVHLGDLGHLPGPELAEAIAAADVLFVPVGGTFTITGDEAARLVEESSPCIAIPMHYRNAACTFPIDTEEPFVSHFERVKRSGKNSVYISRENLPEPTLILVMDYLS